MPALARDTIKLSREKETLKCGLWRKSGVTALASWGKPVTRGRQSYNICALARPCIYKRELEIGSCNELQGKRAVGSAQLILPAMFHGSTSCGTDGTTYEFFTQPVRVVLA
jgi:hypothetical protein